ncbi:hypothetical protein JCM16418A_39840 [Paenibacillus pini]
MLMEEMIEYFQCATIKLMAILEYEIQMLVRQMFKNKPHQIEQPVCRVLQNIFAGVKVV